jgi:hypothetical protein
MKKKTNLAVLLVAALALGSTGLKANPIAKSHNDPEVIIVVKNSRGLNPIERKRLHNLYEKYVNLVRRAAEDGVITEEESEMIRKATAAILAFKRKSRLDRI